MPLPSLPFSMGGEAAAVHRSSTILCQLLPVRARDHTSDFPPEALVHSYALGPLPFRNAIVLD